MTVLLDNTVLSSFAHVERPDLLRFVERNLEKRQVA